MYTLGCAALTGVYAYISIVMGIGDGRWLLLLLVATVLALGLERDKEGK